MKVLPTAYFYICSHITDTSQQENTPYCINRSKTDNQVIYPITQKNLGALFDTTKTPTKNWTLTSFMTTRLTTSPWLSYCSLSFFYSSFFFPSHFSPLFSSQHFPDSSCYQLSSFFSHSLSILLPLCPSSFVTFYPPSLLLSTLLLCSVLPFYHSHIIFYYHPSLSPFILSVIHSFRFSVFPPYFIHSCTYWLSLFLSSFLSPPFLLRGVVVSGAPLQPPTHTHTCRDRNRKSHYWTAKTHTGKEDHQRLIFHSHAAMKY